MLEMILIGGMTVTVRDIKRLESGVVFRFPSICKYTGIRGLADTADTGISS